MERDQSKPPIEAGPLLNLALFAAAWCLWGPLLLFALLMMRRGGESAYGFAVALFQIGAYACPAGALVVAVYAAVVRPWRQPAAKAWFFWMQAFGVAVIGFAAGSFVLGDWRERREHAARRGLAEQAGEHERQMDIALLGDNYIEFESHYRACDSFCPRLPWLRKAVAARAPRVLGLLLKGMSSGGSDIGKAENGSICKDGARYDTYASLSHLAGASGDQAIIDQLMPLWNGDQLQQAFDGAAMGNQVAAMQMLAARGANPEAVAPPRELGDGAPVDDAITFAVRTGSVDALNWLADHGAQLQGDGEKNGIWVLFDEWVHRTPPAVWNAKLEPMLDALARLGAHPAHNGSESLWFAVDARNARLTRALMSRGARIEDVDDPRRKADIQAVLAFPADSVGRDDGRDVEPCQGDTSE